MEKQIKNLIDQLNNYTKAYDEGKPIISDLEWDKLYFELMKLEKESGIYLPDSPTQSISYSVVSSLEKVKHNHPMLSLAKTKDWVEFIRYFGDYSVVGMLKLDGLTCSLKYVNGKLVSAETRGNGEIGENILHNAKIIPTIPKRIDYKDELIIDGEIICDYYDFQKYFSDKYANPRNFASGSIRLLDSKECSMRYLKFICWNVVKGPNDTVIDNFILLDKLGFTVVPWTSSFDWDAKEFLEEQAKKLGYPIDGLVGRFNDIKYGESLGTTGHHTKSAFAFKFYDDIYDTTLLNIEWTMGRTGQITPVAIFSPIDDGESIIERASLHNLTIMTGLLGKPYRNQPLKIYKANAIIPQVQESVKSEDKNNEYFEIPTSCPVCGSSLERTCEVATEVLTCSNPTCEGRLINQLDHFAGKKGLDIQGLSKATLSKLIGWGWVSNIADLYELQSHRGEWITKNGFGPKSVGNILDAIEKSRTPKLEAFISAIGIPMIGNTLSKEIVKYFNDYKSFREAIINKWDFTCIDKVAIEKANAIYNFDYSQADYIVDNYIINFIQEEEQEKGKSLEGHKVVITGSLKQFKNRNELQNIIIANGGQVSSAVSKNTTILINNDAESKSAKNISAMKLGIPILTEEIFIQKYLTF